MVLSDIRNENAQLKPHSKLALINKPSLLYSYIENPVGYKVKKKLTLENVTFRVI